MKNFFLFAILALVLTSCDPELNYFYSLENKSEETVTVRSLTTFSDDSIARTTTIDPGVTAEFAEYHFIGTTTNIESDEVYFEILEIENSSQASYNKDPLNPELWEKIAINKNDGEWLLTVDDSDFQ